MWQEILVAFIGIAVLAYVARNIIRMFTRKNTSPCAGCAMGCPLKDVQKASFENCEKYKKTASKC